MRRRQTLGALGVTALTVALSVGVAFASSDAATVAGATTTAVAPGTMDPAAMSSMMSSMGQKGMPTNMNSDGMAAMHTAMHGAGALTCGATQTSIAESSTTTAVDHAAHHEGESS